MISDTRLKTFSISLGANWLKINPTQSETSNRKNYNLVLSLIEEVFNFAWRELLENRPDSIRSFQYKWIRTMFWIYTKQCLPIGIISTTDFVVSKGVQFRSIQICWKSTCFNPGSLIRINPTQVLDSYQTVASNRNHFDIKLSCME